MQVYSAIDNGAGTETYRLIYKMYKVPSFHRGGFKMCHCTFFFLSRRIMHTIVFNFNYFY